MSVQNKNPRFTIPKSLAALHKTFAHANPDALRCLIATTPAVKQLTRPPGKPEVCVSCSKGKFTAQPHTVTESDVPPLDKVSMDLAGPLPSDAHGNKFAAVVVDQGTRYTSMIPTKTKAAAGPELVAHLRILERMSGRKTARLHTDNAGELSRGAPERFAKSNGTVITTSLPNRSQMNGLAERAIGALKSCTRAQLQDACLPNKYWTYAAQDCLSKLNRIPRSGETLSPLAKILCKDPKHFKNAQPFGQGGYVLNPSRSLRALTPRGVFRKVIGHPSYATLTLLDPTTGKISSAPALNFSPVDITRPIRAQ